MKLNIDGQEIVIDFKYEHGLRDMRKTDKNVVDKLGFKDIKVRTVITTCTITCENSHTESVSIKCDWNKHNREYARKYSLKKVLTNYTKEFRTKVWKAYFEYIKSEKLEYIGINGFGFQHINGVVSIDCENNSITLTEKQKEQLIKLICQK